MEKEKIKISILQMSSIIGDVEANISKVETLVEKYLPQDTDVLILPEVWTVGWSCSHFINSAQDIKSGSIIKFLSKLARIYNINIIGGSYITKQNDKYYNTCLVLDRSGNLIASYSKMHLYSYFGCNEGEYITPGEAPVMVNIEGVNFGLSICYDIRFPEIYRAYAKSGADVLVNCAAWGSKKPIPWEMMTKSRAIENQCYMIALTQSGYIENGEYNLGHSRIINYVGEEVSYIMEGEGVVSAEISIKEMKDYRAKAPTINDIRNSYEVKELCVK